ncbi:vancomycin high temperature exclusion protein [Chryseobacterium koreense]|uniref:SanA/YdcF family protein n=1 Tax=Chryseobacterium koreense TaxID=232216 RepID=UPI0026F2A2AE|nr:ElyC/SanA/YdcF family protein [Chryseobacterium koreense]
MKVLKKITYLFLILFVLGIFSVWLANLTVTKSTAKYVTSDLSKLGDQKVGLVLGTSEKTGRGYTNYYFKYRIDAAEKLYKSGKVKYLIVSGDNSQKNYNEPEDMMNALIARGIPKDKIYQDFAGFRTLDSVLRAEKIFGQKSFIIVSQKFHNERAVYLARKNNIQAYGFNAEDVKRMGGLKTKTREYLARVKVFVDLLFEVDSKFGGAKVIIP